MYSAIPKFKFLDNSLEVSGYSFNISLCLFQNSVWSIKESSSSTLVWFKAFYNRFSKSIFVHIGKSVSHIYSCFRLTLDAVLEVYYRLST